MDKTSQVLNLMSDGKPRTASEIQEAIGSRCGSIIYNLYQKGTLWATDIKYFMMAMSYKGGGKWKRPHGKQRWYLLPEKGQESPLSKQVCYLERDETGRKNVEKTELMVFKPYSREKKKVLLGTEDKKIISVLQKSKVAVFPYEIASKTGISEKRVASILFRLTTKKEPEIRRSGWRRREEPERTEQKFRRGFLYYTNLEQLKARIDKRDVLDGQKQAIYQRIRKTTEIDRQFTKLINLARELGIYSKTVADYLEETACVYADLKKEEIAGSSYYYIDGILTPEEIEKERQFAKTGKSEESSYKLALGKAHEDFCQFAIDQMMERGDFKVGEDSWWTEVIDRKGKRRRRDIFMNSLDASKRYEYDAILNVKTPVGKEPNILVWEMKYRGNLTKDFYDRLVDKLADTRDFSTVKIAKGEDGHLIRIKTGPAPFKSNITPVFVIPTVGSKSIEIAGSKMNFAQYVTSQGGKIVFTQEYERILEKYYPGKKMDFERLFSDWWKLGSSRGSFEDFLIKYLKIG